jgi:hypothetical protein
MLHHCKMRERARCARLDTILRDKIKRHVTHAHQEHLLQIKVKLEPVYHALWANFRRRLHQPFAQNVQLDFTPIMRAPHNVHHAPTEHGAMKRQKSLDAKTYAQQVKVGIAEAAPLHAGFAKEDL